MTRIGITMYWEANPPERAVTHGEWKFTLNRSYCRLFDGLDAVPSGLLPVQGMPPRDAVSGLHGLVMTGGDDPSPELYGRENRGSRTIEIHRPLWEMELYREARAAKIPILAVCLGMQLAAVAEGTPLIQDIASSVPGALDHENGPHRVHLVSGSTVHRLLGERPMVSSVHHQALESLPPGYRETGRSSDGILEAMESKDGLVIAVQWHPERDGTGSVMIREFVRMAREGL
jgi:putative glutamine amidotransferase